VASSLARAWLRPRPVPAVSAPSRSASYSRDRLMAIWISAAAIGARTSRRSMTRGLDRLSRSLPCPPPKNRAIWAT